MQTEQLDIITGTAEEVKPKVAAFLESHPNARILGYAIAVRVKHLDPTEEPAPAPEQGQPPVAIQISDAAEKLAKENGIDPSQVTGTGKDGLITKPDIEKAIAAKPEDQETPEPIAEQRIIGTMQALKFTEEIIHSYTLAVVHG